MKVEIERCILWSRANGEIDYYHNEYHLYCPSYRANNCSRVVDFSSPPLKKLRPLSTKLIVMNIHGLMSKDDIPQRWYQKTYKALRKLKDCGLVKCSDGTNLDGHYIKKWQLTSLGYNKAKKYEREFC